MFVTEILSSGTLKSFINRVKVIRWKIAKRWAIQILKGLEYLHSQKPPIIHRDLKCDNIFINGTSGDLRIGDLGLSTVMSNKGKLSVLGTPEFMAPELYDEAYDQTIDIYAFGMCMLEIFTKELPYRECTNPAQIYKKVTHGREPESLSRLRNSNSKDFIRLCLGTSDGSGGFTRPTATELLSHPFLGKNLDDDSEVEVDPRFMERPIPETLPFNSNEAPTIESEISRMNHQVDADPRFMERQITETAPFSNGEGWRNSNESSTIENDINSIMNHPPSPPISNVKSFYSEDDPAKQTSNQDVPFFRSNSYDNPVALSHVDERSQITADPSNSARENDSSHQQPMHQQPLEDRGLINQYRSVPVDQDLNAILTTQVGAPLVDDVNGSSNAGSERFSDRDMIQDTGSGLESDDEFIGMPNSETNIKNVTVLMGRGQEIEQDEESTDEFVGMPNSETNIRKVTVLMGRGQEIEEDDDLPTLAPSISQQVTPISDDADHTTNATWQGSELSSLGGSFPGSQQYLTAADVAEDQNSEPPFAQDKMTVVMTQSVEPYHVQFEFHLIEDDPVQVAREMVTELNMTEDAVLKLSENLSALARSARMKQQSSTLNQQKRHDNAVQPSVAQGGKSIQAVPNNLDDNVMDKNNGTVASQTNLQLSTPSTELSDKEQPVAAAATGESDDDDVSCSSEYRQLKKEYESKVKRAKKAYDTRMENLHRSREEKEAQHKKTLERHEKERVALEKRVKQEEEIQNRRLLQIQEEWTKKCAHAKKSKVKSPQNSELPPLPPSGEDKDSKPVVTGFEKNRLFAINLTAMSDKNSASAASASSASTTPSLDGSCSDKSR